MKTEESLQTINPQRPQCYSHTAALSLHQGLQHTGPDARPLWHPMETPVLPQQPLLPQHFEYLFKIIIIILLSLCVQGAHVLWWHTCGG